MEKLLASIAATKHWPTPEQLLRSFSSVAVFGTGQGGASLTELLAEYGIEVSYYLDNDQAKHGGEFHGKPVMAPEKAYEEQPVVLIASFRARDIAQQLHEHGVRYYDFSFCTDFRRWKNHFDPERFSAIPALETAARFLNGPDLEAFLGCVRYRQTLDPVYLQPATFEHYFHPKVSPTSGDTYVDGGAWQGDTVEVLKHRLGDSVRIHCFEPDSDNREILLRLIDERDYSGVTVSHFGLWNCTETLRFLSSGEATHTMQARVDNGSGEGTVIEIQARDLDGYCMELGERVDYIKLDVEGAEPQVISGAARILQEQQPRLAISAYHEPEQLWQLLKQIHEVNPAYQFCFAHHSQNLFESVIYAWVGEAS
ncbi:FkbM family methyltransferase [Hydrocarboniclastica marina]|uniref:FkbM family methyltransferase n=1 Tax=Hydrocarboniclastica marina TaxID=2259620 RepID=UPI0010A7F1AD|nr:FkbM family methyltransferase [Hydrocarboniclastica marina]